MKRARGFAIISAIFILVVLAALGAFILNISSQQQIGSALDVQGVRAVQAARAGIEWGMYQVNSTTAYNFSYGTPATVVGVASPNLRSCTGASGSFAVFGFTVTVTCVATTDPGGFGGPTVYSLTSTACSEPSGGACPNTTSAGSYYVERRMTVTF
jgi:MSHA biogenesis protein MshP